MKISLDSRIGNLLISLIALAIFIKILTMPVDSFLLRRINEIVFLIGIFFLSVFMADILKFRLRNIHQVLINVNYKKFIFIISIFVFLISSYFSISTLEGIPHIQDEIVYLFQAKTFAMGKLYATPKIHGDFFDYEFIINDGSKWYGKYFWGFPLILSLGWIAGLPWIINPIIGAILIVFLSLIGREIFGKEAERFIPLLCLFSPFYLFMCASHLSHPTALLFLSIFIFFLIKSFKADSWKYPFFSGLSLGYCFNIRPYDSLLMAFPFLLYSLILLVKKEIKTKQVILFILSFIIFLILFLLYNFELTGNAFQTPFGKYCPTDRLGFGKEIGLPYLKEYGHTFLDGLENTRKNLKHISEGLLGWPILTFLLIFIPFLFKTQNKWDWIFIFSFSLIVFGYIFYYFDGIAFGARYYFIALPMLLALMIRGIAFIDEPLRKFLQGTFKLSVLSSENVLPLIVFFLILRSVILYFPERINEYGNRYWNIDRVLEQEVKKADIHNAVVFIKSGNFREGEAAPNYYGAGFLLNSPNLDTDIVYARDLGDEKNKELMAEFAGRKFYRFIFDESLITSERYYILNIKPTLYKFPKPELGMNNFFRHIQ